MISRIRLEKRSSGVRAANGCLENGVQWYCLVEYVKKGEWVTKLVSSLGDVSMIETQTLRGAEAAILARLKIKEAA